MSEVKLNLIDKQRILQGKIHGSIVDACVAALSAEPETIAELEAALTRYVRPTPSCLESNSASAIHPVGAFASFRAATEIDTEPWDAGLAIIDLAARVVAAESSYSQPQPQGEVLFHDGAQSTDIAVMYRVAEEWKFFNSLAEYESCRVVRSKNRADSPLLDTRSVLYGRAFLGFTATSVRQSPICRENMEQLRVVAHSDNPPFRNAEVGPRDGNSDQRSTAEAEATERALADEISAIHARWLLTCRDDLEGQSPRDVLLAKQDFIDFDLHTREIQWAFQGEGPPCLSQDSSAYRNAGFGTHECVVYYDLVRHLLWTTLSCQPSPEINESANREAEIAQLEQIKNDWLENPQGDYGGRVPAIIIENERRRLPLALSSRDMIIDEDCELCVMSANAVAMGYGPGFWHLDGSHMDDEFAFSFCRTREEWEEENLRREEFNQEFDRRWEERQQRQARGELVDEEFGLDWKDSAKSDSMTASVDADDESTLTQ
jgi:hypothetical protein